MDNVQFISPEASPNAHNQNKQSTQRHADISTPDYWVDKTTSKRFMAANPLIVENWRFPDEG